jgi:hypothetical protein
MNERRMRRNKRRDSERRMERGWREELSVFSLSFLTPLDLNVLLQFSIKLHDSIRQHYLDPRLKERKREGEK